MVERFSWIAVVFLVATTIVLLVNQNWRQNLVVLCIQYLAAFWLFSLVWPLGLALVKLLVGWMAGAVIAASQPEEEFLDEGQALSSPRLFRILSAGIVLMFVFSIIPMLQEWLPANLSILRGGAVLVGMGLLQLGVTIKPLRVIVGLLTLLTGFELLYAVVETSVLVAGLLALVNLGLALVGVYLFSAPELGEQPELGEEIE